MTADRDGWLRWDVERNSVCVTCHADGRPMIFAHGYGCDYLGWSAAMAPVIVGNLNVQSWAPNSWRASVALTPPSPETSHERRPDGQPRRPRERHADARVAVSSDAQVVSFASRIAR